MIKVLKLINGITLIAGIEEVGVDIGEPDCKITEPFLISSNTISDNLSLSPWLLEYTTQNTMMISSDKILTIVDPSATLLKKYEDLIK